MNPIETLASNVDVEVWTNSTHITHFVIYAYIFSVPLSTKRYINCGDDSVVVSFILKFFER
jgi:hypothetical protein